MTSQLQPDIAAGSIGKTKEKEIVCDEVTASLARGQKATAEQVSPAVSPAISLAIANGREQPKPRPTAHKSSNQSGSQSGTGNGKPNCYECKHRRSLSYSAHSECRHPALDGKGRILAIASIMRGGRFEPFNVRGSEHGLRNAWFSWPMDFDPVWLESCDAFEHL